MRIKQLIIDEAINGFMLTIIWDDDKLIKELFQTRAEVYKALSVWLSKKMDQELKLMKKSPTWEVI
jgi:hypothetical protein